MIHSTCALIKVLLLTSPPLASGVVVALPYLCNSYMISATAAFLWTYVLRSEESKVNEVSFLLEVCGVWFDLLCRVRGF